MKISKQKKTKFFLVLPKCPVDKSEKKTDWNIESNERRHTVIEIGCIDAEQEKGDPPPTRQEAQVEADETQRRHIS